MGSTPAQPDKGHETLERAVDALFTAAMQNHPPSFVEVLIQHPPRGQETLRHNSDVLHRALLTRLRACALPAARDREKRLRIGIKNQGTHGITYVVNL